MKQVHILSGFTGYPDGKKRAFAKGEEPSLPAEFADMIVAKKLARKIPLKSKAPVGQKKD